MTDAQIAGLMIGLAVVLTLIVVVCWASSRSDETTDSGTENESCGDKIKGQYKMSNENTESNFCTNCGTKLEPGTKFCPNCGTPRSSNDAIIRCPVCGSTQIQFVTAQGGQRIDKSDACCGYLLCGPLGLLCGVKDQDAKTVRKCMNCNHEF